MCIRRKKRTSNTYSKSKKTQTSQKKKRPSCCVLCIRKICSFFYRRMKRRIKKKILSVADPIIDEYEVSGVDLDILKQKLSPNFDRIDVDDYMETFRTQYDRLDPDNIKKKFISNLDRFSLHKLASMVTLFRNKNKFSKINISVKDLDLLEGLGFEDLKNKFSIKGSKEKLLEKFVHDYNKGNLSASGSFTNKSKYDSKKLDKDQLHKMLESYAEKSKNNRLSIARLIAENLANKMSLNTDKKKLFEKVMEKFKKGHLSKSATSKILKLDAKKLSKKEISMIIKKFQEQRKSRRVTFARPSKLEQLKSAMSNYFVKPY